MGVFKSSLAFSDIDNDGDQDLFIADQDESNDLMAKLYLNNNITTTINSADHQNKIDFNINPNIIHSDEINIHIKLA